MVQSTTVSRQNSLGNSSTSSEPQQSTTLEEYLKNYHIDFGTIMDIKEARESFEEFLKKTMNTEAIEFIKSVENYHLLRSTENRYREATRIVEEFLQSGAKSQINISEELLKTTLDNFQKCNTTTCSATLFDLCTDVILVQLQQGPFHRFVETPEFIEFVRNQIRKKGRKALEEIGRRKSTRIRTPATPSKKSLITSSPSSSPASPSTPRSHQGSPVIMSPLCLDEDDSISVTTAELLGEVHEEEEEQEDSEDETIDEDKKNYITTKFIYCQKKDNPLIDPISTKEDVEYIQFLTSQDPAIVKLLFKPTIVTDKYQSFICRKPVKMGKKQGVMIRLECEYPFDYEKVAHVYFSKKFKAIFDPNVYFSTKLDEFPANKSKGTLAGFIIQGKLKIMFPFSDRYYIVSSSVVKDSQKEQILDIRKSCKFVDKETGVMLEDPKLVLSYVYGGLAIQKIGPNRCKIVEVYAVNLNSLIPSQTIAKAAAKRVRKVYKKVLALFKNEFHLDTMTQFPADGEYPIAKTLASNSFLM